MTITRERDTQLPHHATEGRWTPLRVLGLTGAIALLLSCAALSVSAAALHAVDTSREGGFVTSEEVTLRTDGYALTSTSLDLEGLPGSWLLGETRLRINAEDADSEVFVGVAEPADVAHYLAGVAHSTVSDVGHRSASYEHHEGTAPTTMPTQEEIWIAQDSGSGTRTVTWPKDGPWTALVMNGDGSAPVAVQAAVQAEAPHLAQLAVGAAVAALAALVGGTAALLAVVRRGRASGPPSSSHRGARR
jgi:hypothetical protein